MKKILFIFIVAICFLFSSFLLINRVEGKSLLIITPSPDGSGKSDTCTSWTYSEWGECLSANLQTRSVVSSFPNGCEGGNPSLVQSCVYTPPTCTLFLYSDWGDCINGQQIRAVTLAEPQGCAGGSPILNQECYSLPFCTENNWTSTLTPTSCPSDVYQKKEWMKISECQGGISHPLEEIVSCDYQISINESLLSVMQQQINILMQMILELQIKIANFLNQRNVE